MSSVGSFEILLSHTMKNAVKIVTMNKVADKALIALDINETFVNMSVNLVRHPSVNIKLAASFSVAVACSAPQSSIVLLQHVSGTDPMSFNA